MPDAARPIVVGQKKRGFGCCGCGCAIVILIGLLVLGLLLFLRHAALELTGRHSVAVATTDAGPAVYGTAERKLDAFEQAFEREQPATLNLNSAEINTLIARDPGYARSRGRLAISLQGQTANLQASFPLGEFETTVMADRFLNANATFGLSFDATTPSLLFDVQSLALNGQQLPPSANTSVNQLINQIVNQRLQANQLARDFLARVQKADIENGELVIEIK